MFASFNGFVDVVKALLECNAQVDLQDIEGWSSLMLASFNGHVEQSRLFWRIMRRLTYCSWRKKEACPLYC